MYRFIILNAMLRIIALIFNQLSNVANLIAIITFVAYIIGRFWKIYNSRIFMAEQFVFENYQNIQDEDIKNADMFMDFGGQDIFSISSPNGIRAIKAYKVEVEDFATDKLSPHKIFLGQRNNINKNQKCYIRTFIPCGMPSHYLWIEIEREDYMIFSFTVSRSFKDIYPADSNDKVIKGHCKYKMPFKSWIYYLCS